MPDEAAAAALEETAASVRACVRCRLHESRTLAVPGEGRAGAAVFLLGEAPGREEDLSGRPFVGAAGKILDRALRAAKLARADVFVTNVVKCRPPSNRAPKADEVDACRAYLLGQIASVRPRVIVTLGSTSLKALTGSNVELKEARTRSHAFEGRVVIATYHPAAVLYNRKLEKELGSDLRKVARLVRERRPAVRSGAPRRGRPVKTVASSGGVVLDATGRILLLKRADESLWCLPKGTQEAGESLESTARREILEETGLRVKLLGPVHEIRYAYFWPPENLNYDKTVSYFLAEPTGGALHLEAGFDDARWVTREEALSLLHWRNDRDVVTKAFALVGARSA